MNNNTKRTIVRNHRLIFENPKSRKGEQDPDVREKKTNGKLRPDLEPSSDTKWCEPVELIFLEPTIRL